MQCKKCNPLHLHKATLNLSPPTVPSLSFILTRVASTESVRRSRVPLLMIPKPSLTKKIKLRPPRRRVEASVVSSEGLASVGRHCGIYGWSRMLTGASCCKVFAIRIEQFPDLLVLQTARPSANSFTDFAAHALLPCALLSCSSRK